MSLQDAFVLGQCYARNPGGDFLADYQRARIPQTSQEVTVP
jgi:2-polyprenyl-6-methoxyphenol hydroxylase-like FAD-dependent oxidoreductase